MMSSPDDLIFSTQNLDRFGAFIMGSMTFCFLCFSLKKENRRLFWTATFFKKGRTQTDWEEFRGYLIIFIVAILLFCYMQGCQSTIPFDPHFHRHSIESLENN